MMMDNEVYGAAAGLKNIISIPPHKMNQHYLMESQTQGPERSNNNNILHVAAQHANSAFISAIHPHINQHSYFALLCQQNSKGETPLHLAAESGDKPTVEALLQAHDQASENNKKLCWRERDNKGDTPLHKALRCGYDDIAVLLLGRDGELVSCENNAHESVAYLAAVSFCFMFLQRVLDPNFYYYSSVSFSGPRGMTVFHPARKLTDEIMSDLIKARKGLLKNQDEMGKTVLHYAVEDNLDLMVKKLLTADSSLGHVYDIDGMTPLHRAASLGFLSSLKAILDLSPQSILEVYADGMTALHVAVTKRDARFVRVCLQYTRMKELINVPDDRGDTPLHLALSDDVKSLHKLDVADALLEVDGINWRLGNNKGLTPADLCHSGNDTSLKLKSLTSEWRRVKEGVNTELFLRRVKMDLVKTCWDELLKYRGPYGDTILHKVARDGDIEMIKRAERDSISDARVRSLLHKENARGETPLHMAAVAGKIDVVKFIAPLPNAISDNTNLGKENMCRRRHLHHRIDGEQFKLDILEEAATPWLVKSGNGDTPAHKALRNGHDDVALHLLKLDFSLASFVTDFGESLLYLAAQNNCALVVQEIMSNCELEDSSSLVFSGPYGQNPLHGAVRNAGGVVPEIVDASFINMLANTVGAISSAASMMRPWVGSDLIKYKPELSNKADNYGKTPLHYAVELDRPKAVKTLIEGDKLVSGIHVRQRRLHSFAQGDGYLPCEMRAFHTQIMPRFDSSYPCYEPEDGATPCQALIDNSSVKLFQIYT